MENVAVVGQQRRRFLPVEHYGPLLDLLGFVRASQFVEHPGVGVEVGRVVVLERHDTAGHGQRPLQIASLDREEVGVVVQHHRVVGVVAQAALVGAVATFHSLAECGRGLDRPEVHPLVPVGDTFGGLQVPRVADHAPDHAAQRIRRGIRERLFVGPEGPVVVAREAGHMSLGQPEVDPVGEEPDGLHDVAADRVGPLLVALDVDDRAVVLLHGRLVVEVALVERKGLVQLPGGDQVAGIELHDALVVGILDGQYRGQVVELQVVFAVEADVRGVLFELADLRLEREFVGQEQPPRDGQQRAVILSGGVVVGQRHERCEVRRVDPQRLVELRAGQRVASVCGVEVSQCHVGLGLVGGRCRLLPGLIQGSADLSGGHEQAALHAVQHGNTSEAHLGRVEQGHGLGGLSGLLVERREDPVEVRLLGETVDQAAVDGNGPVVLSGEDERLAVELMVPLVGRIEPVGASGQLDGLLGRGIHSVGYQLEVGRGVVRVAPDGLGEEFAGPQRIARDGLLLDALGVEPYARQRVGICGCGRSALPRHEGRGEERTQKPCRHQPFHACRRFRAPGRTGGGNARRFRSRGAGP